jgi:hypothetical protein
VRREPKPATRIILWLCRPEMPNLMNISTATLPENRDQHDVEQLEWLRDAVQDGAREIGNGKGTELHSMEQCDPFIDQIAREVSAGTDFRSASRLKQSDSAFRSRSRSSRLFCSALAGSGCPNMAFEPQPLRCRYRNRHGKKPAPIYRVSLHQRFRRRPAVSG